MVVTQNVVDSVEEYTEVSQVVVLDVEESVELTQNVVENVDEYTDVSQVVVLDVEE